METNKKYLSSWKCWCHASPFHFKWQGLPNHRVNSERETRAVGAFGQISSLNMHLQPPQLFPARLRKPLGARPEVVR